MKKLFDSYTIIARIFPSVLSSLPILVLWYFVRNIETLEIFVKYLNSIKYLGDIGIVFVLVYFYSLIGREVSKYYQNLYFDDNNFPTTYFLLYTDSKFSKNKKDQIREKIKNILNINLPKLKKEKIDLVSTKQLINESIQQIIVLVGDNYLVKKHNIWYGFYRNLIGGITVGIFLSLINIAISFIFINDQFFLIISIFILILYIVVWLFKKPLIVNSAEDYANKLLAEFLVYNIK